MKKPFYRLADFKILNPLTQGKAWVAICPICGRPHLYIDKQSGLFHCFEAGCGFSGILDDYKDPQYQHNALGIRYCDSPLTPQGGSLRKESNQLPSASTPPSGDGGLLSDIIPEDYTQLDDNVLLKLKPIDTMPEVVHYLEEQKIPVDIALNVGCYAAIASCYDKEGVKHTGPSLAYVTYVFGNIVNIKYRCIEVKAFTQDVLQDKTLSAPPFNIDCINPIKDNEPCKTLYLTEGEKDALSLRSCGYDYVISPPNGSGSKPETCLDPFRGWLELVEHVVICGDTDRPGRTMKRNFKTYFEALGKSVSIATLPYGVKDISEVYQQFGADAVKDILNPISTVRNQEVVRISDDRRGIKDVLMGRFDHGYSIGYGPCTDQHFMLTDEGGLIIVTGRPNHGKTSWKRCTLTKLMMQLQKKVCFLSFEEPNKRKQVRRIIEISMDTNHTEDIPSKQLDDILDVLDERMINLHLTVTAPTPTNIIRQCDRLISQGFRMDFLYVDPYLFIQSENAKDTETLQIKQILTTLQNWGRNQHIWVIVVAHPRKLVKDGLSEYEDVDEYTISGSAHWANLADYLLSVKRVFPGGMTDEGSQAPSFTMVNMLKVRDQSICHTGRMYYLRHPSGRYEERKDEATCKQQLGMTAITFEDCEIY